MANFANKIEWTEDEAIERFNEDMSNSICDGDRKMATRWFTQRLEKAGVDFSSERVGKTYSAWMEQFWKTKRELAANGY